MKRIAVALALFSVAAVPATAAEATWRTVQYRSHQQVTINCGAALLCEIELQPGERVRAGLGSEVPLWDNHLVYSGDRVSTPHLSVKPESAGLHENVLLTTTRRTYRLFLNSTRATSTMHVIFSYDDEGRAREHAVARRRARQIVSRPEPKPTVAPIITLEAACASMAQPEWRVDPTPSEFHPRQICESPDHTFIALPQTTTQPSDLPIPLAVTPDGDRPVNYRYDADTRVFMLDGAGAEYAFVATAGRRTIRLRMQRVDGAKK